MQTCDRNGVTVVLTTPPGLTGTANASIAMVPAGAADASRVVETYEAPATSLSSTDAQVCAEFRAMVEDVIG